MNPPLPPVLYINRDDRPDRRAHMEEQLMRLGFRFERIPAIVPITNFVTFHTPGALGNWISHMVAIERADRDRREYLILEDDVVIKNVEKLKRAIEKIHSLNVEWIFLYLFGVRSNSEDVIVEKVRVLNQHSYLINPRWTKRLLVVLRDRLNYLMKYGKRDRATYCGNFLANIVSKHYPFFYGTQTIIVQNRKAFGSDTGWMEFFRRDRK